MSKLRSLQDAIAAHVKPGMHLNFASTPSRSNASVRELARAFRGKNPGFCLSATGFHSTLHLLSRLRLGARYIACFFGDNYPAPRPNRLYQTLLEEGVPLEQWSLWSYVSALRAAAFGQPYAVTCSLGGTTLGEALAREGRFVTVPDPLLPERDLGLVTPLAPDIVFLHAVASDASGNVICVPPHGEGFHGALAARAGVIVTVERVVDAAAIRALPHYLPLPPHRILAVCEEPYGAHPQPFYCPARELEFPGYRDDFEHYVSFRRMATDDDAFEEFSRRVLDAPGPNAYVEYVGGARLADLTRPTRATASPHSTEPSHAARPPPAKPRTFFDLAPHERMIVLGARGLVRSVRARARRSLLAGIGQSFAAARLCRLLLDDDSFELMIETGFAGLDAGAADPFLLSYQNQVLSRRLTSVDSVLGALTCGADNACIGAVGAAEVDESGNINSTRVGGTLLVGSGGANDIASSASEVAVFCRLDARRLVGRVEYVTSPGRRVLTVVTEEGVLERDSASGPWFLREIGRGDTSLSAFATSCPWSYAVGPGSIEAPPPTPLELEFLRDLAERETSAPARRETS